MESSFWRDRRTFITGGTGLVGNWLVRRLMEAGADVICLVRDWVPQSELVRSQQIENVTVVRGFVPSSRIWGRTYNPRFVMKPVMKSGCNTWIRPGRGRYWVGRPFIRWKMVWTKQLPGTRSSCQKELDGD
jgi:hypothetical protein